MGVTDMKKQIEERKMQLIKSGIAPAIIMQNEKAMANFVNHKLIEREKMENEMRLENQAASIINLTDAEQKAKRAAELQLKIKEKMKGKTDLLNSLSNMPSVNKLIGTTGKNDPLPIEALAQPKGVVVGSDGVAVDSTTGRMLQLSQRMPTLKVNIREKKREQLKVEAKAPEPEAEIMHFDPRLEQGTPQRQSRQLKFHQAGKFQQLAQRLRAKAQLDKLQKQIAETAKKTGIITATKLAALTKQEEDSLKKVPEIEWWDASLCPNRSYNDVTRKLKNRDERYVGITSLVEHPIQQKAPCEATTAPALPIFLTKKERKK